MLRIEAGRKVLDQINGKTRQIRQDGYINLLNKYGTAQDNSTAYQWEPETPVTDYELTELYQGGSLFAKIIDAPADEAVKNGIDLGVTDEKAREYIEDSPGMAGVGRKHLHRPEVVPPLRWVHRGDDD